MDLQPVIQAVAGFLAIIVVLVVLHEFGHYLVARMLGVVPKAFSVGMGPEIFATVDKHGTRWKLSALPVGGYVKFRGEMHPSAHKDGEVGDFALLPRWKRSMIVAAGPAVNLIVAGAIFLSLASLNGYQDVSNIIASVEEDSPAAAAGIKPGDRIISWNGDDSPHMRTFVRTVRLNPESNHRLEFDRNGQRFTREIQAGRNSITDDFGNTYIVGANGLSLEARTRTVDSLEELYDASLGETISLFGLQASSAYQMATGARSLDDLSGPLRMAKMSGEQLTLGLKHYLYFAALVSIAIAFMNLLPIPGLDGGYLALYAFEGVTRSDVGGVALKRIVVCGYFMIAALTALALTNDVRIFLSP